MNKLTFIEKAYLRGLLEETMREHEKYLETSGEYPDGKRTASNMELPSQSELINIFRSIYKKV